MSNTVDTESIAYFADCMNYSENSGITLLLICLEIFHAFSHIKLIIIIMENKEDQLSPTSRVILVRKDRVVSVQTAQHLLISMVSACQRSETYHSLAH